MEAIDIENLLKSTYVGKPYDSYHGNVGNTVLNYLASNGFDRSKMTYEKSKNYSGTLYIAVYAPYNAGGNVSFITIETKKKKGNTHHAWYGSYCDWEYKDFLVTTYDNETVEDSCKKAVGIIQTRLNINKSREDKAQELFDFLKAKGYNKYDAIELVRFASDRRYTLSDNVYDEKK